MDVAMGDGNFIDERADQSSDAISDTPCNTKQVEEVLQSLIDITDNSISNSWTILSTDDENNPEAEDKDGETNVNEQTSGYSHDTDFHQQTLNTNHCILSNDDKTNCESWLQVDDINSNTSRSKVDLSSEEHSGSILTNETKSKEIVTDPETETTEVNILTEGISKPDDANSEGVSSNMNDKVLSKDTTGMELGHKQSSITEPEPINTKKIQENTDTEGPTDCNEVKPVELHDEWVDILGKNILFICMLERLI